MAPEQARGQTSLIGEATDIHALGLLLFEMLTGRAAFASSSPADLLVRLLNEDPPPLRSMDRRIPRDLETICQKMLQKSPAARYSSVSALLEDIRRFEVGEPLAARRTSIVIRTARWTQRHWKIGTAVVVTALLMLVIAVSAGPRLFDRTQEELIVWAEEHHADGRHRKPSTSIGGRWKKPREPQRNQMLRRMVECCREIRDAKELIAVALPILDEFPEASFGKHDYLVAQAVYADIVERHPNLLASVTSDSEEDYVILEFAASRYEVFLNGGYGTQQEHTDAKHQAQLIHQFTDQRRTQPASSRAREGNTQLPQGSPTNCCGWWKTHPWDTGNVVKQPTPPVVLCRMLRIVRLRWQRITGQSA